MYGFSQNYTINQGGSISTCNTTVFDSDSLLDYQNNENYTMTFCSDGGGNIVNIGFATLFAIHPSDTLYIYDGNTISSPLIGKYNNDNIPPGLSSSTSNTSGCITLHFVSDAAVVDSGWSASINCITTCQPIHGVITTTPTLIDYGPDSTYSNICPGDNVQFSVSGTYPDNGVNPVNYAQSDATSTFVWSLGLGGSDVLTQTATATYPDPQGYFVMVTITDANGCSEQIRHKIRVGIPPIFSGIHPTPDTTCFGDTVSLIGGFNQTTSTPNGVTSTPGSIAAGGTVTGETFLPDGSGTSYTTSVSISGFSGQTIAAGTDISSICMNIEHSYIGDLTIELSCPSGASIILSDTYNGTSPASTFLGDANDDGSTIPGIGMDYCFNLGAAWGTMLDENNANNWIPSTVTPGNNILTPGSFQPEESFNNLIGCPVDGNWSITVTDNLGIDNGYIFEWGIALNPAINPNAEPYTVAIVDGYWLTNPDIINYYDTSATAASSNSGIQNFTFQITDEYGCTFDTIIDVFVHPELIPIASPDTIICATQQATLDVDVLGNCNYSWSPTTGLSNPLIQNPIFSSSTTTSYTVTTSISSHPQCTATSNTITVEIKTVPLPTYTGDSIACYGDELTLLVSEGDSFLWPDGSTESNITFTPEKDTILTVIVKNFCSSDTISKIITVNPLPITTMTPADTLIILQESVTLTITDTDLTRSYLWTPNTYLNCDTCVSLISTPNESITYTIITTDTNGCINSRICYIDVQIPDLFIPTGFTPNGDGINDIVFVRSLDISSMSFQVYDRWGGLVFETSDQTVGWDGTFRGKDLDFGVYVYKFEATLLSGKQVKQSGSITLFR